MVQTKARHLAAARMALSELNVALPMRLSVKVARVSESIEEWFTPFLADHARLVAEFIEKPNPTDAEIEAIPELIKRRTALLDEPVELACDPLRIEDFESYSISPSASHALLLSGILTE